MLSSFFFFRHLRWSLPAILAIVVIALLPMPRAQAQGIAATVNGDTITTTELDEMMRYLRIIKQPSSRPDALEDLVADRLKLHQANRNGMDASEASLNAAFLGTANKAKTTTSVLLGEFQRAKLNTELIRAHFRAVAAWTDYVKSRNKSLAVSEEDISAAMAKDKNLGKSDTDYQLQQIVFVVPVGASPGVIEQRMRDAQAFRARFQGCAQGLPLARALPDVAVKPPVNRNAVGMAADTRKALEQTGIGRLTPPSRSAAGIDMIAVCSSDEDNDHTSIRDSVSQQLLGDRLEQAGNMIYKGLRENAVVEKR